MTAETNRIARSAPAGVAFLAGGGDMAARVRAHDWSASLGAPHTWPFAMRVAVGIVLESAQPKYLAWGRELRFIYNDAYALLLGDKHPRALGQPFAQLWPEIWDEILPFIETVRAGKGVWKQNYPLRLQRRGTAEPGWFTFSLTPARDDSGAVAGVYCAITETTDAVLAGRRQRFLLDLGERLRGIDDPRAVQAATAKALGRHLDVARVGYAEVQADGEHILVRQDWADGRVASVAGRHRMEAFGPAIIAALRAGQTMAVDDVATDARTAGPDEQAAYAAIGVRSVLCTALLKAGVLRALFYLHHPEPRRWSREDARLLEAVAERSWDAVGRARAEAALRANAEALEARVVERTAELAASEARLRAILDSSYQFTGLLKPDGSVVEINRPALDAMAATRAQVVGRKLWESPWWRGTPAAAALLRRWVARAAAGDVITDEALLALPRGEERAYRVTLRPLTVEHGRVGRLLVEAQDITQTRRLQEELVQAQKMQAVGQLTGGVAHDFNNLLQIVTTGTSLIDRLEIADERLDVYVGSIRAAGQRGAALTQQLLAFSRTHKLEPEIFDLGPRVAAMRPLLEQALGGQIAVATQFSQERCNVEADANQLELAVLNLAVNARDAMPDGGQLTIGVAPAPGLEDGELQGDFVRLWLADTGVGIEPQVLERIFEPFYTTKEIGKGSGLGLAQVYGFAHNSGGGVRVASGKGGPTVVELFLPCCVKQAPEQPAAAPPAGNDLAAAVKPQRILLVEDDDQVAAVTGQMLTHCGHEVIRVAAAGAALEALAGGCAVDIVVSDVMMAGGMSGVDLAQRLRADHPDLPVLLVTGYEQSAAAAEGGIPVLHKPFAGEALNAALGQALQRARG